MQRLDLNLASNPFRNNTLLWAGYGTATVLLVLFTVWNVNTYLDYRARLLELRNTVGTFATQRLELETRGKRALAGIRGFDIESLENRAAKANQVIEWKAFSWTRLFNVLERVLPNQVRMNSVRPIFNPTGRAQDSQDVPVGAVPVAIEGTARSFDDLAQLQRAFQADPQIGRVEPERVDKTDNGEFVFQMRFLYVPYEDGTESERAVVQAADTSGPPAGDEPVLEEAAVAPDADATATEQQDAGPAPLEAEVAEPGPAEAPVTPSGAAGAPAAKARRTRGARRRSDPRGRRPAAGEDDGGPR